MVSTQVHNSTNLVFEQTHARSNMEYQPMYSLLGKKIPLDLICVVSKYVGYLKTPSSKIIKTFYEDTSIDGFRKKTSSYKSSNFVSKVIVNRIKNTSTYRWEYPRPGFYLTNYKFTFIPDEGWKHAELVTLAQGLSPVARKSWNKKKLLQHIYPSLKFL